MNHIVSLYLAAILGSKCKLEKILSETIIWFIKNVQHNQDVLEGPMPHTYACLLSFQTMDKKSSKAVYFFIYLAIQCGA